MSNRRPTSALVLGFGDFGADVLRHVVSSLYLVYPDGVHSDRVSLVEMDFAPGPAPDAVERVDLGCDVRPLLRKVADGGVPRIVSWFRPELARWLLESKFPVDDLKKATAAYRPIGRLALFSHLERREDSALYRTLRANLSNLRHGEGTPLVLILASTADAVSAALALDVTNLIRRVAAEVNVKIRVHGVLALPLLPEYRGQDKKPRALAFAFLRELERFVLPQAWDVPYQITYLRPDGESRGDSIWAGKCPTLFDHVCLLSSARWEYGKDGVKNDVAVSTGDVVLSLLDSNIGRFISERLLSERGFWSIRLYTAELPLHKYIDRFGIRFVLDAMKAMGIGAEVDDSIKPDASFRTAALWRKLWAWHRGRDPDYVDGARGTLIGDDSIYQLSVLFERVDLQDDEDPWIDTLSAAVPLSDEIVGRFPWSKRDPIHDSDRVIRNVYSELSRFGFRVDGKSRYRKRLDRYIEAQLDVFRGVLKEVLDRILNGPGDFNRLGTAMAFLSSVRDMLEENLELQSEILSYHADFDHRQSDGIVGRLEKARDYLEACVRERRRRDAIVAQHRLIDAGDAVLQRLRAIALNDAMVVLLRRSLKLINRLSEQAGIWLDALTDLKDGLERENKRVAMEMVGTGSHSVIRDENWESDRYGVYLSESHPDGLRWGISVDADEPLLELKHDAHSLRPGEALREALLKWSRSRFKDAMERESILAYYVLKGKPPDDLAAELLRGMESDGGGLLPGKAIGILAIRSDDTAPKEQRRYRDEVASSMKRHLHISGSDESRLQIRDVDSRFHITLMDFYRDVRLGDMVSYSDYRGDYMNLGPEDRAQLHIFPAEVNAALVEGAAWKAKHPRRMLPPDLYIFLEHPDLCRLFWLGVAYDVIGVEVNRHETGKIGSGIAYAIKTRDDKLLWWLHEPQRVASPEEAISNFVLKQRLLNRDGSYEPLNRDAVGSLLESAMAGAGRSVREFVDDRDVRIWLLSLQTYAPGDRELKAEVGKYSLLIEKIGEFMDNSLNLGGIWTLGLYVLEYERDNLNKLISSKIDRLHPDSRIRL